jgi:hypothetical protein
MLDLTEQPEPMRNFGTRGTRIPVGFSTRTPIAIAVSAD